MEAGTGCKIAAWVEKTHGVHLAWSGGSAISIEPRTGTRRVITAPPSGEQFEIRSGPQRATIVEVGGGVREYFVNDRPVLDPYPVDAICDGDHGTPLIPWPNRLEDGAYWFEGKHYEVPLTEPKKGNAIHGFLVWRSWQAVESETNRVVMGVPLRPLDGYPFSLDVRVAYELGSEGLIVSTTATNLGEQVCPYGRASTRTCRQEPVGSMTAPWS